MSLLLAAFSNNHRFHLTEFHVEITNSELICKQLLLPVNFSKCHLNCAVIFIDYRSCLLVSVFIYTLLFELFLFCPHFSGCDNNPK